jgi:hypothetical protein
MSESDPLAELVAADQRIKELESENQRLREAAGNLSPFAFTITYSEHIAGSLVSSSLCVDSEMLGNGYESMLLSRMEELRSKVKSQRIEKPDDSSPSFFFYRGFNFQRTSKGHWFFDGLPPCCNAWQRYGTDEEVEAISETSIGIDEGVAIMHKMIDRALAGQMVFAGDLCYRQVRRQPPSSGEVCDE